MKAKMLGALAPAVAIAPAAAQDFVTQEFGLLVAQGMSPAAAQRSAGPSAGVVQKTWRNSAARYDARANSLDSRRSASNTASMSDGSAR